MTDYDVKQAIVSKTKECFEQVREKLGFDLSKTAIHFDLRGVVAGQAFPIRQKLRFNLPIAEENFDHFIADTVPHEVAHLAACKINPRCVHGREWKYVMRHVFKLKPERCHNYDVTKHYTRKIKRYIYYCGCQGGVKVGPKYHKRLQAGSTAFSCRRCNCRIGRQNFIRVVSLN